MSVTLETLSPLLTQQYDDLPWGSHLSEKKFQLELENSAIIVSVVMERIKMPVPKTEVIFLGKAFENHVTVETNSENHRVFQVVKEHFTSQGIRNPWGSHQEEFLFDSLVIDGLRILPV